MLYYVLAMLWHHVKVQNTADQDAGITVTSQVSVAFTVDSEPP